MSNTEDDSINGPVLFQSDKKQKFGISNSGDFIDNLYREQDPSKLFGMMIGRNSVEINSKKVFSSADVVCEGYLYKKGSWMKNWKRRYFVLRKDIRTLCYYDSRENLTLLGSIPLDLDTQVSNVKPENADGYDNVVALFTEYEDGSSVRTLVRFESFEKMKAWMIDIKNEAHNMIIANNDSMDWWTAIFEHVKAIEPKSSTAKRDAQSGESAFAAIRRKEAESVSNKNKTKTKTVLEPSKTVFPPSPPGSTDSPVSAASYSTPSVSPVKTKRKTNNDNNVVVNSKNEVHDGESDDESDTEARRIATELISDTGKVKPNSAAIDAYRASTKHSSGSITGGNTKLSNKKIKHLKPESNHGPPPFATPTATRFQDDDHKCMTGLQFSLKLSNVCSHGDKIFVAMTYNSIDKKSQQSMQTNDTDNNCNISGSNQDCDAIEATSSKSNTKTIRTEIRTVTDKPIYGENYIGEVQIHFSIMEGMLPDNCKDIKFTVYRLENDMSSKEPAKASNLNMQFQIAKTVIPKKLLDLRSILKIVMKVTMERPMDIAVPLFKEAEVLLGVNKMSSNELYLQKIIINKVMNINPYSEIMYSFCTHTGHTMSLEQLYASKYSIAVARSLLTLWQNERNDYLIDTLKELKSQYTTTHNEKEEAVRKMPAASHHHHRGSHNNSNDNDIRRQSHSGDRSVNNETIDDRLTLLEQYKHAIDVIDAIQKEIVENAELVLQNCLNMEQGKNLVNAIIDYDIGGGILRRSAWKKITAWQYCATNLNLHLLTSRHYTFNELINNNKLAQSTTISDKMMHNNNSMHYCATVTMGVPAAHELKFSDGGLRKIFIDILDSDQKLKWIFAIQYGNLDYLKTMFENYPRESQLLFGIKYTLVTNEDLAFVLKRKIEISERLDICGSQALGGALTVVRTIIMLAASHRGRYLDILARSLKIGFLILFQSYLSSQGSELGMIEDMDIAVQWLSLVTLRLVRTDISNSSSSSNNNDDNRDSEMPSVVGYGDGISIKRDLNQRLIVDLEISPDEAEVIEIAKSYMAGMRDEGPQVLRSRADAEYSFRRDPQFYSADEAKHHQVCAVAELYGVTFTQGVNEMQTLANMSSSREVLRQIDINNYHMGRFDTYYHSYRRALHHQLIVKTPELLHVLRNAAANNTAAGNTDTVTSTPNSVGTAHSTTAPSRSLHTVRRKKSIRLVIGSGNNSSNSDTLNSPGMDTPTEDPVLLSTADSLKSKVLNSNDRMLDQLKEAHALAVSNPHDKHVDVLLKSSALAREMSGVIITLCKSGKDRTSMGVTLESTRSIVEELGVIDGEVNCQTMRMQGVRRMNVYANTGQPMFAFNPIQRLALPNCFRPPPGTFSGSVNS